MLQGPLSKSTKFLQCVRLQRRPAVEPLCNRWVCRLSDPRVFPRASRHLPSAQLAGKVSRTGLRPGLAKRQAFEGFKPALAVQVLQGSRRTWRAFSPLIQTQRWPRDPASLAFWGSNWVDVFLDGSMRDSRDTGSPWKDAGRKTPFRQVFTTAAAEVSEALNCEPSGERGCCRRLLDRRNPLQETGGAARGLVLLPRSSSAAHAPLGDGESGAEFPNSKGARPSTWASPWGGVPHPLLSDGLPPALSLLPNVAAARTPLRSARGETSSSLGHWKARGKEAKSGGELERAKSVSAQTSSALATPQAPLRRHPTALRPNPSAQSSAVGRETLRSHRPGALRSGLPSADKRPAETPRLWRRAEKSASGQVSEESLAKVAHFRATKVSAECALRGRLQRLTLGRRLFTSRTAKCQVLARRRRALEESSSPKASSALHEWRASGSLPTPSTATADTPPTFLNSFQLTAGQAAPSHLASRSPPRKRLQTSPLAARRLSPLALSDDDFALPPPARDLLMGSSASCEETTVSAQRPAGHSPSARSLMRRPPSAESASFSRRSFWAREGRSDSGDLPSQSSSSSRAVSGGTFSRKAACSSLGIVGEAKTVHRRRRQRERPGNSRGDKDETDGGGGEGKPARSSLSESLTADEEALLETFRLQRPWQSDLGFLNESGLEGVGNRQASAAVEWWAVDRSREEEEEEGEALRSASATSARALSPWQRCFDLHLDRLVEMSPWMAIPQRLTRSPGIRGGVCADTWRMDSDACLKMSGFASFAAAGRKGAARWSDLPLGLRLRVCWFLNGKELQALSASGRGGREAAGHSHSWMIRCTRRWAPCLAASAEQTRSLPFGKSPADRLALRRRLRSSAKQVSSAATETPAEAAAVAALAKNVGGEPTGVQHEGSPSRLCRRLASAVEESAFANAAREVSAGVLGAWLRKTGAEEARERRTDAEGRGCEFQGRSVFKAKDNAAAESGFSCARVRLGKMKSSRRDFQRQQEHRQEQTSAAERGGNGPWFSAPLTGESPCAPWDRWAAFHLNDAAMNFDYRLVLLSRNGWRAAVSAEWRSKMPPLHWTRRRVKANPSLVNTMDGR